MINKVDNSYKPAFGTFVVKENNLKKIVRKNKDVSPYLEQIDLGIQKLRTNGNLDALKVKFNLVEEADEGAKFIRMICNWWSKGKKVSHEEYDLFLYNDVRHKARPSNEFCQMARTANSQGNKKVNGHSIDISERELVKNYSSNILPSLYQNNIKPATVINRTRENEASELVKTHVDLQDTYKQIEAALKQIKNMKDDGILDVSYFIKKSTVYLKMDLTGNDLNKITKRRSVSEKIPLCRVDDNLNVDKIINNNDDLDVKDTILVGYNYLKQELINKIG